MALTQPYFVWRYMVVNFLTPLCLTNFYICNMDDRSDLTPHP